MFLLRQPVLFSPKLCRLNCALCGDLSLLILSAKDRNSQVFSYFQKNQELISC